MSTKEQLIELGQESLAGGEPSAAMRQKYHHAVVAQFLGMAYDDLLQILFADAKGDTMVFDAFTKPFKAIVAYDSARDEKYITLPAKMIPLTPKQAGIRAISMYKGQQIAFAPVQSTASPMWAEMEAMKIDSTISYYLEGESSVFFPGPNVPETGAQLMVKLICTFAEFADTDEITVPGGKNEVLFNSMYQFMNRRGNRKQDTNDNVTVQQ
jgi:hypothetical protein